MTIEQLLDMDVKALESMTDSQLNEIFEPYLKVTRPDSAAIKPKTTKVVSSHKNVQAEAARLLSLFTKKL